MSLSNITLTAAVRQNLLSLQGTADLLATTQGRLATGKKVNSALDNPTNFFTAAGLDSRASDISNLLDSIGNGVQVLQAANTGITSLSKLVDTAKSIANQVLQQPSGDTSRATVSIGAPAAPGTATDLTNAGANTLQGKTLIFKTASGTTTLTISNVAGATNVNSIDSLNTALSAAGVQLQASFNTNGSITFTSSNDAASQTITATGAFAAPPVGSSTSVDVSGTATFGAVTPAVADAVSPQSRNSRSQEKPLSASSHSGLAPARCQGGSLLPATAAPATPKAANSPTTRRCPKAGSPGQGSGATAKKLRGERRPSVRE